MTSPALIEKVRSATTDEPGNTESRIFPSAPTRSTFTLEGFTKQQRDNVVLTTGFTAPVNATMAVGQLVRNRDGRRARRRRLTCRARVRSRRLAGADIRDLPTTRNIRSILTLTPGLTATGLGADCVGGVGVWCNNNIYNLSAHTATNDNDGGTQGRVMVDGTIINTGGGAGIMGMTGGYVADVANAQEVNVQISGALGESETGGASINIIPRTGGNRFAGNYFMTFTRGTITSMALCARAGCSAVRGSPRTTASFPRSVNGYPLIRDYDTSGAFGGPIKRDRLWFFSTARAWQKDAWSRQTDRIWDNTNAGIWGQNYQADRSQEPLQLMNMTRNANVRITLQASQKNKFNFFWDEGLTCQDPCGGSVAPWTARDGWWSGQVHPARLMQASWTNPLTNVILLEAGLAVNRQLYDFSQHRYYTPNPDIPRVVEFGSTVGVDAEYPCLNQHEFQTSMACPRDRGPTVSAARRSNGTSTTGGRARRSRTSPARTTPSSAMTAATSRRPGATEPATRAWSTATTRPRRRATTLRIRRRRPAATRASTTRATRSTRRAGPCPRGSLSIPGRPPSITGWPTAASTRRISGR